MMDTSVLIAFLAIMFQLTISVKQAETYAVPGTSTDASDEQTYDFEFEANREGQSPRVAAAAADDDNEESHQNFQTDSPNIGGAMDTQLKELITSIKHFTHDDETKQETTIESSPKRNKPSYLKYFPRSRRSLTTEIKQELLSLFQLVEKLRYLQSSRDEEVRALLHAYYEKIEYILELLSSSPTGQSSGLGQVLNKLMKRRFLHDAGKRPAFHSWGGKRSGFHSWDGKRSETPASFIDIRRAFHSRGGKRKGFHSWGGKRGYTGSGSDYQPIFIGRNVDRPRLINLINRRSGFHSWGGKRDEFHNWRGKRGGFHSWGGKRDGFNSWEGKRDGFHSWGGKRDGFHSWGGKRDGFYSWGGKRDGFHSWGGKRDGFHNWGGKRDGFHSWGGKRDGFQSWGGKRDGFHSWGGKRDGFNSWGRKRDGFHSLGLKMGEASGWNGMNDKRVSDMSLEEIGPNDFNADTDINNHHALNLPTLWKLPPNLISESSKTIQVTDKSTDYDGTLSDVGKTTGNNDGYINDVPWETSSSGKRGGFNAWAGK